MGRVARLVCACPALLLVLSLLLTAASIWVVATRFNVVNNTSDLLSDKYESKKDYNELLKDFGSDSRFIVPDQVARPAPEPEGRRRDRTLPSKR